MKETMTRRWLAGWVALAVFVPAGAFAQTDASPPSIDAFVPQTDASPIDIDASAEAPDAAVAMPDASVPDADLSCLSAPLPTTADETLLFSGFTDNQGQLTMGTLVECIDRADDTVLASDVSSETSGAWSFEIATGGLPINAYLRSRLDGLLDTYVYPAYPIASDLTTIRIGSFSPQQLSDIGSFTGVTIDPTKGTIVVAMLDCKRDGIAGGIVSSLPVASDVFYFDGGPISKTATATDASGLALLLNVPPGEVTFYARVGDTNMRPNTVEVRGNAVTLVTVEPLAAEPPPPGPDAGDTNPIDDGEMSGCSCQLGNTGPSRAMSCSLLLIALVAFWLRRRRTGRSL